MTNLSTNKIRFQPSGTFSSNPPTIADPTITVRAADQSRSYTNASLVNAFGSTSSDSGPTSENLNSFSDAAATLSVHVQALNATVYVDSTWAGSLQGQSVTDSFGTFTFGINAFATVQNGVTFVAPGGTVNVHSGTYAENVIVGQPETILGPNTAFNPLSNTTPANAQAIVEPGAGSDADASSVFLVESNSVTISGLTIQGSSSSLSGGFLLPGGAVVYAAAGISNASNVANAVNSDLSSVHDISGLNVSNNIIKDFKWVGVYGDTSDDTASGGNTIASNDISDLPWDNPAYAGEGVLIYDNFYASVTGNVMTAVRTGVQTGNDSSPDLVAETPSISNNQISAFFRGIYDNLQYDTSTEFAVDGNTITFDSTDLPAGYDSLLGTPSNQYFNYNVGLLIQSLEGNTTSQIENNNVSGFIYGVEIWDNPTSSTVVVQGGTLSNNTYGVFATNNDPRFGGAPAAAAILSGVDIQGSTTAGVYIQDNLAGDPAIGLTIEGNTAITGGATGILVSGPTPRWRSRGATPASISGQSGDYITLAGGAEAGNTIDASSVAFGTPPFVGATGSLPGDLSKYYGVEDHITDGLDDGTVGYVSLLAGNVFLAQSSETANAGAIQRAVNVANSGDTIFVQAGTYAETVNVDKSVTLKGAQAGNSADSRFAAFASTANGPKADPSAETIITAPFVDPTGSVGMPYDPPYDDLLRVTANNVTIDGFVLDGNNPLLDQTNALQVGGVNADARRAIDNIDSGGGFNNPVSNLQIVNNVIQNFGDRGISLYNNGTAPAVNNLVEGNVIRNFAGYGVLLFTNAYTDIENNTINGPTFATGIQLQNFYNVSDSMTWSGNDITVGQDGSGIVANLFYAPNATLNISGNTINAASGVTATDVNGFTWGVIVDSVQATSTVALTNNLIGNLPGSGQFDRGMDFWNVPTSVTVAVTGGTIGNSNVGVELDNVDPFFGGAGADSTVDLSNVAISGGTAGVVVNDTPLADDSFLVGPVDGGNPNIVAGSVTLNVSGGSITNATNGIEVEAPASGAIHGDRECFGGRIRSLAVRPASC